MEGASRLGGCPLGVAKASLRFRAERQDHGPSTFELHCQKVKVSSKALNPGIQLNNIPDTKRGRQLGTCNGFSSRSIKCLLALIAREL